LTHPHNTNQRSHNTDTSPAAFARLTVCLHCSNSSKQPQPASTHNVATGLLLISTTDACGRPQKHKFNQTISLTAQKFQNHAVHHPTLGRDARHTSQLSYSKLLALVAVYNIDIQHTHRRAEGLQAVHKSRHKPILQPTSRRVDLSGRRATLPLWPATGPAEPASSTAKRAAVFASELSTKLWHMSKSVVDRQYCYEHQQQRDRADGVPPTRREARKHELAAH
jgi:hypothetical protein